MENCSKEQAISEESGLLKTVLGGILGATLVIASGCEPTYLREGPYYTPYYTPYYGSPVYVPQRQHVRPPRPYIPRSPQFMPRPSPPRPHK